MMNEHEIARGMQADHAGSSGRGSPRDGGAAEQHELDGILFRKDRGDRYQILELIGRGQLSTVHRARDVRTGEFVVLKRIELLSIMDAKLRRDCVREVDHLRSLSHPTIIRYLDNYIQGESMELVIVLEWARGGDLAGLLRAWQAAGVGVVDERVAWHYFVQVCDAVRHMHQRRLMHRDLKPSNIFLADELEVVRRHLRPQDAPGPGDADAMMADAQPAADGRGQGHARELSNIKVGDLGLSRYFSSKTCQAHSSVGTPYYMSPELIRGLPYDWSSDVWSLGCLLYELRTCRNPFFTPGLNYYMLGKRICAAQYEPLPAGTSERMQSLVAAMLHPDHAQRPTIDQIYESAAGANAVLAVGG